MTKEDPATGLAVGAATEPLLTRAAIVSVGTVVLGIAVAWGLNLSQVQQDAVLTALGVAATFGAAWWARRHVNSPASTARALAQR
jgi:hypothetical protein